jgi:hypothetical protein
LFAAWWIDDYMVAAVVLIAAIGLWRSVKTDDQTVPMSRLSAAVLLAGFIVAAGGHGYAGYSAYTAHQKSTSVAVTETSTADHNGPAAQASEDRSALPHPHFCLPCGQRTPLCCTPW